MGVMRVVKLREGLWQWGCPHPDHRDDDDWDRLVWSTYVECGDATVVVDPLVPQGDTDRERFWRALDGDVARRALPLRVLLTCAWHARSAAEVAARYQARVHAPDPEQLTDGRDGISYGDAATPAGIELLALDMPAPKVEVAFRIGDDVLVTGDLIHLRTERLVVAPASWYDETPESAAWYRTTMAETVARLFTPLPAMVLTGHGHELDPSRIARFAGRS